MSVFLIVSVIVILVLVFAVKNKKQNTSSGRQGKKKSFVVRTRDKSTKYHVNQYGEVFKE